MVRGIVRLMERFITDMGEDIIVTSDDGGRLVIGRYGVWETQGRRREPEVIDTGSDLDKLQEEYGPDLDVHPLNVRAES